MARRRQTTAMILPRDARQEALDCLPAGDDDCDARGS
jgi:hypothetical protein